MGKGKWIIVKTYIEVSLGLEAETQTGLIQLGATYVIFNLSWDPNLGQGRPQDNHGLINCTG